MNILKIMRNMRNVWYFYVLILMKIIILTASKLFALRMMVFGMICLDIIFTIILLDLIYINTV